MRENFISQLILQQQLNLFNALCSRPEYKRPTCHVSCLNCRVKFLIFDYVCAVIFWAIIPILYSHSQPHPQSTHRDHLSPFSSLDWLYDMQSDFYILLPRLLNHIWRDQPRIDEYFTQVLVPLLWLEHVTANNITKAGCQVNLLQNIQWGRTLVFCGCDDCHIPPSTHPQLFTLPINTMKCCNLHVTSESNTSQGFCRTEK